MRRCATSPHLSPNPPSITRSEIKALVLDSVMKSVYAQSAGSGTALQSISMYAAKGLPPKCTPTPDGGPQEGLGLLYSSVELRHN